MDTLTWRAVVRLGLAFGLALLSGCTSPGVPAEEPAGTIKNVIIEEVDEAAGTISVSFGNGEEPTKLANVPLAEGVRVVASHVRPGSVNHLPFQWNYVKRLQGKTVSVRLDIASTGLSVTSIASGND